MKPAPFAYHRATSVDEALALLAEHGADAKPLAGGQSLVPAMNFRLAQPAVLVDLDRVQELTGIREAPNGGVALGAMTRQRTVERSDLVAARAPLVHATMPWIAHPQIRNRGTVGGSLAHADPAAELPAVMLALDARFRVRGPDGERDLPAAEFFTGLFATALEPGALLLEVVVPPMRPATGWAFREIARRHGDFALVGVAAVITLDGATCTDARVVLFSVGDGPVPAPAVRGLVGHEVTDEGIGEVAAAVAADDIDPPDDIHASAEYRRRLARVLTARALTRAAHRAREAAS